MRTIAGTSWSVEAAQAYILARVREDERGCWVWQKAVTGKGYGKLGAPSGASTGRARTMAAHRLAYEAFVGPIPDGLWVLHRCDNPPCCNHECLFLGTVIDNNADMKRKRRHAWGERSGAAMLTEDMAREVLRRITAGDKQAKIAADFGITQSNVSAIKRGVSWTHLGGRRGAGPKYGDGHHAAKLTRRDVVEILRRIQAGESQAAVGSDYGIAQAYVSLIKRGLRWGHVQMSAQSAREKRKRSRV